MEKKQLFTILANADQNTVAALAEKLKIEHKIVLIKEPSKTLTMIQMREPVKQSLFYLGEVIVCEAVVELDGVKGIAVTMGDNTEKVLNMAVIDAAFNKGVFTGTDMLLALEAEQKDLIMRENALHLKTMVNFNSMDEEVPSDVSVIKKA